MTPEAQRIAIAEACGWTVRREAGRPFKYFSRPGDSLGVCCGLHLTKEQIFREFFVLGECGPAYVVPDYLNDLNACHEAEKVLTPEQQARYAMTLHEYHGIPLAAFWHRVICSTAAQRAEAFLRTLGKWTDD